MKSVTGTVLMADGIPASGAQVAVTSPSDPRPLGVGITDSSGRFSFSFAGTDGADYRLTARSGIQHQRLHSTDVPFTSSPEPSGITLILDRPGLFDGDPIIAKPRPRVP